MRTLRVCVIVLLTTVAMTVLGCRREFSQVAIEIVPREGCAPLRVELIGTAVVQEGITPKFVWTIGGEVHLEGASVRHTFERPGTYAVALTVSNGQHQKTRRTTMDVRGAELPSRPGLYRRQACAYRALQAVQEITVVKDLGRTSLEDLEKRIVGRALSTAELVTHPLWRRPHTHTIYTVARNQFVELPLEHFHTFGVLAVSEAVQDVSLLRLIPAPEPLSEQQTQVVTRVIDSWGVDSVEPERLGLKRTPIEASAMHYVPLGALESGFYLIDVKSADEDIAGLRAVTLTAPRD